MQDMRTRLPANVTRERNRHGTAVYYFRVGKGKRIRLPDYGSEEFEEAYQAARLGETRPRRSSKATEGTVRWLVEEYKKSLHFRGLDEITQRRRDSFFCDMVDKAGDGRLSRVTMQTIVNAREKRAATGKGHSANNFLKAVKPMFAYAKERGWIDTDPTKDVDYVKPLEGGREAWTIEDVKKYEEQHPVGTMANLAVRILLFTGLRRSDAVLLGRQHVRAGMVRFKPGKTEKSSGVEVEFTALRPLLEAIAATKGGNLTFLVTEHGQPFASGNSFGNKFKDWCKEAGVRKSPHGLRKLGPTLAAEAGASPHELMAMWGWTTLQQPELYTRTANRRKLGQAAASKLMESYDELIGNNTPRTSETGAGIERKV